MWSKVICRTDTLPPPRTKHVVPDTDLFWGYELPKHLPNKKISSKGKAVFTMKMKYPMHIW